MSHKHVTTCEHEIKVCDCCDTAYCAKCDKQWSGEKVCALPHYPTYVPTYIPYVPVSPVIPTYRPYWSPLPFGGSGGFMFNNVNGAAGGISPMLQLTSSTGANTQ